MNLSKWLTVTLHVRWRYSRTHLPHLTCTASNDPQTGSRVEGARHRRIKGSYVKLSQLAARTQSKHEMETNTIWYCDHTMLAPTSNGLFGMQRSKS